MCGNTGPHEQNAIDADGSFSWASHSMANRISYAFDLTGPSIYLDTACSSSLTALHLAIGAIEKGDCTAALVGAAQINRDPFEWTTAVQAGVLAADGRCRPFDAAARGFVVICRSKLVSYKQTLQQNLCSYFALLYHGYMPIPFHHLSIQLGNTSGSIRL